MGFFFVKSGWDRELDTALRKDNSELRIICPFIKKAAAARLLDRGKPKRLFVITRASLDDFYVGVSDIEALNLLLDAGAQIHVVRNLHTKLYIFGSARVILTSANLTEKALRSNHEFGFVADSRAVVRDCAAYFNDLWTGSGKAISQAKLTKWRREVTKHKAKAGGKTRPGLPDYGTEVDQYSESAEPDLIESTNRAFVKFFGEGHNRSAHSSLIFDEVKRSGCHWACTYPKGRRPRSVRDGDIMFMGCLVEHPKDILVYGRAVATHYRRGIDDATPADKKKRWWKDRWPHYIRVHNPEFLSGPLSNGVSLKELMRTLGANSFAVTQRNAALGTGNTAPRKSLMQQAAVKLSVQGSAWLTRRLEQKFKQYGQMNKPDLNKLIRYG
jgi:hypothetical protein